MQILGGSVKWRTTWFREYVRHRNSVAASNAVFWMPFPHAGVERNAVDVINGIYGADFKKTLRN